MSFCEKKIVALEDRPLFARNRDKVRFPPQEENSTV